jgi:DNA-directed RNA polymerase specialized sigma24 family protein
VEQRREPIGKEWLAQRFEDNRAHLRSVAYRMLGSITDAEDAVQETWLRLSRAENSHIDNMRGWLTTVVGRICFWETDGGAGLCGGKRQNRGNLRFVRP